LLYSTETALGSHACVALSSAPAVDELSLSRFPDAGFADLAKRPVYRGGGEGYIGAGYRLVMVRSGVFGSDSGQASEEFERYADPGRRICALLDAVGGLRCGQ